MTYLKWLNYTYIYSMKGHHQLAIPLSKYYIVEISMDDIHMYIEWNF